MRIAAQFRRLAPALLAALVLCAALVSTAHAHASAPSHGSALAADSQRDAGANGADLDCALCAAAARLSHGGSSALPLPVARSANGFPSLHRRDATPPLVVLARREARAPPQLG